MIHNETKKLAAAAMRSTAGARRPSAASEAAAAAPATMNSAFMILLAAIMRERSDGAAESWMMAYSGTEKMPPHAASRNRLAIIRQPANEDSAAAAVAMLPADAAAEAKSQQNSEMPSAANGTSRADTSPCSNRAHCTEPTPTPTANTDSSSVSTVPSECSVSRATTGNSVISVAPMVQNQESPSTDSQIGRIAAAWRVTTRQVSMNEVRRDAQRWIGCLRRGDPDGPEQPDQSERDAGRADPGGAVWQQHQGAAHDGAANDRQERGRFDYAISGDQFVLGEMLGQQAVFHRAKQRRLHT